MGEVLLIIFVVFTGGKETELYEYPMKDMNQCLSVLEAAPEIPGVAAFCVPKIGSKSTGLSFPGLS